jgi:hypothetical protein
LISDRNTLVVPLLVGGETILVEATQVTFYGTEPTSHLDRAAGHVRDAFAQARATIVAVGTSAVAVAQELATASRAPDVVEIELGLSFTAKCDVIVAGATAGANLKIKIVYNRPDSP